MRYAEPYAREPAGHPSLRSTASRYELVYWRAGCDGSLCSFAGQVMQSSALPRLTSGTTC